MKDYRKVITRRIFLLMTGKDSLLNDEEKKIIKDIDMKISINLIEPDQNDFDEIDKIFSKYF